MFDQLLGSSMLVGSLVALVHALRTSWPTITAAVASREAAKLADANVRTADATARAAAEADIRARLAHCEESHSKRDAADSEREERFRRRELEHAREMGHMRGMLSALRDQIQALPKAAATAAEGHV